MFSQHVTEEIGHYVYRLIDPRNGETFYVGKGIGNRVFAHIKGEAATNGDELSQKLQRIREIRLDGFEVGHIIHRHGLDERTAYEVEAALIDAYPAVTNSVGGHYSDERGVMHATQIVQQYGAPEAVFRHRAIMITINHTAAERSIYDAVRYAWKIDPKKAREAELVLAIRHGIIVGVFEPSEWLPATPENFPSTLEIWEGRWGFIGEEAPPEITRLYLRHRIPDSMRKRGAANPVRYVNPSADSGV
ncbi:MAG: hypothetical protein SFW64_00540 [Alphaproteobacteria bacterium]|nr:hypothetical protein [Alphaproteobacteria bacterium]